MKLSSLEIQQALEYSKVKNVNGLCRALNRHWGVEELDYPKTLKFVTRGAKGAIAKHIAYEIGLSTPDDYKPLFKPKKQINKEIVLEKRKSKFRGVHWNKQACKWVAEITVLKKKVHLGYFLEEIDAAIAYNKAAAPLGRKLNEVNI